MDRLILESTAALVMRWSLKLYETEITRRFLDHLDLRSGDNLYNQCQRVCDWYEEIILNRKYFIKHLIEQEINSTDREYQLVILAAGKSPLSMEILMQYSSRIHHIIEIDITGMADKRKLCHGLFPAMSGKLSFIDADIISPDIAGIIDNPDNGFRRNLPTIFLLEGISYYFKKQELQRIIANVKRGQESFFIVEYLVPYHLVNQRRRDIPLRIFEIICSDCGLDSITSYTREELSSMLQDLGVNFTGSYNMMEMELARTVTNTFFKSADEGWIECITARNY